MKSKNRPKREKRKHHFYKTKTEYVHGRDNDAFVDLLLRINQELAHKVNELESMLSVAHR